MPMTPKEICEGMKYPAIFFEDGDYIGVEFPDLPGCFSQGKDIAEAALNASKALVDFLDSYKSIPKASDVFSLKRNDDTLAIKLIEVASESDDSHELMYNKFTNRLVTFPKNQEYLGDKLSAKIQKAAGI